MRDYAIRLVREKLLNTNLFKHCLATEACLKELAAQFGEDQEKTNQPLRHGIVGAEFLEKVGIESDIVHAIKVHAGHLAPESKLDWALFTADPVTGLIVASALMHPDKKLQSLDNDFVMRRYKEKRFAAGANREQIASCSNLGLELEQFIGLCLQGMQKISDHLGL